MGDLAPPLERAIDELSKLPSIGRKTAQRLVFHLLNASLEDADALAEAIRDLRRKIRFCTRCFNLAEDELCPICADPRREQDQLCVVEEPTNLLALEGTGSYRGLYHVLGGSLSPLKDIGPDRLHIRELIARVRGEEDEGSDESGRTDERTPGLRVREVIMATNPDVEGEATAVYLSRLLKPLGVTVTRLAQGLPAGGHLEYTDALTIRRALEGRRDF